MPVSVQLVLAVPQDRELVERLLQLYEYDNTDFTKADIDPDGLYRFVELDAIWEPGRQVFLLEVEGHLAGFAFVTPHESLLDDGVTNYLDEFFVMRKYRRQGVGESAARALFDRFSGRWELATLNRNESAKAFWRTVISRYASGKFREVQMDSERWRGPVWAFESAR